MGQGDLGFFEGQFDRVEVGGRDFGAVAGGYFLTGKDGGGLGLEGLNGQGVGAAFEFSQVVDGFLEGGGGYGDVVLQGFGLGNDTLPQVVEFGLEKADVPPPTLEVGVEAKGALVVLGLQGVDGSLGLGQLGFEGGLFPAAGG